ncbi:hypothetical protein FKB33_00300 [Enterococcus faecium]|nr:hypothetical protein [Enterococcus faecium]
MLFFQNRELIFVHDKQKRGNVSKHASLISGSIIYGTDESELILQPHFILGIKNISFSSMIKSRQNKQLRGRYAI